MVLAHVMALFFIELTLGLMYFTRLLCGLSLDISFLPGVLASCLSSKTCSPGFKHQASQAIKLCLHLSYSLYQFAILIEF